MNITDAVFEIEKLKKANADLTRQLSEAKAINTGWIERCRGFRENDARKADAKLSEALAEIADARDTENILGIKLAECVADYEALEAKLAALVEVSKKFSDRLDFVHEHNDFKAIWFLAHSHYGDYKGPRYEQEFKELKAAVDAAKVKP